MTELREQLQATLGGTYTIERELGGGGMSRVFLATENALGRRVVIKVLPPDTAAQVSLDRFKREISLAAQLQQAHIVQLLSAGDAGGLPYYTMPFVEGESLRARLAREGELPISDAISILKEVARALAYAHQRGVVHRDIKPDNVLLSGGSAMVTDFGVAKALSASSEGSSTLTSLGTALGTPAYMAPEQASADPAMDHRADIYSFGAMAYELLTGRPPFAGRSAHSTMAAHISETPHPVDRMRDAVPPALAHLVMQCLAKRPADRPKSAGDIVHALESVGTPSAGLTPAQPSTSRHLRRWPVLAGVAVTAVAIAGVAFSLTRDGTSPTIAAPKSIAVLPFMNLSGVVEDEPFAEGMTIGVTDLLGRVSGFAVPAPSLARSAARELQDDIRAIGKKLGVTSLLQGDFRRGGDSVRINVRLVSTSTGTQEWSEQYDVEFKDHFAIQDRIARAIASALRVTLGTRDKAELARVATTNPEAHELYLRGLYHWNRRTYDNLQQAISYFEQAIAKDPNYVEAYAGVAMAYAVIPTFADVNNPEQWAHATEMARRALAIDSTSAQAHAALGFAHEGMYRWASAEREFRTAIRFDSTFATAFQWLGQLLSGRGQHEEGIRLGEKAAALDPDSRVIRTTLAQIYQRARRFQQADSVVRALEAFDSTYANTYRTYTQLYISQKRYHDAVRAAERGLQLAGRRVSSLVGYLAVAHAGNGDTAKALALVDELLARSRREPITAFVMAYAYEQLGDREQAIYWLERSVAQYDPWYVAARLPMPQLESLRSDPRAAALLAVVEASVDQR